MTNSPQQQKRAILFADISGSTALYDKLGDVKALELITLHMEVMIAELAPYQGILIKTIGDEILCTFPSAAAAFEAACAMQTAIARTHPVQGQPLYIRIGFHYGDVICEGDDVFGDAVNVAARVTAITRARQIMTTQAAVDALPPELARRTRKITRAEFRGKEEALDVFLVNWELDDTLSTRIGLPQFRKPTEARHELMLRHRERILTISEQRKSIVLGREDSCDLVIQSTFASRQHARIELNFGKFVIADHSANGTYIRFSDNQVIHLARQEIMLHGAGAISLGQPFSDDPAEMIEYLVQ